jgi:vancomycin aglycone glucosyltransferase
VGLAVQLRALGVEVRMCAPPDKEFTELLAGVGVPLLPVGPADGLDGAAIVGGGAAARSTPGDNHLGRPSRTEGV